MAFQGGGGNHARLAIVCVAGGSVNDRKALARLGEMEAGEVWAAVAEHPSVNRIDRTHRGNRTSLGLWLSPHDNGLRGRFLTHAWRGGDFPLGPVVAIPAGLTFHVRA